MGYLGGLAYIAITPQESQAALGMDRGFHVEAECLWESSYCDSLESRGECMLGCPYSGRNLSIDAYITYICYQNVRCGSDALVQQLQAAGLCGAPTSYMVRAPLQGPGPVLLQHC